MRLMVDCAPKFISTHLSRGLDFRLGENLPFNRSGRDLSEQISSAFLKERRNFRKKIPASKRSRSVLTMYKKNDQICCFVWVFGGNLTKDWKLFTANLYHWQQIVNFLPQTTFASKNQILYPRPLKNCGGNNSLRKNTVNMHWNSSKNVSQLHHISLYFIISYTIKKTIRIIFR